CTDSIRARKKRRSKVNSRPATAVRNNCQRSFETTLTISLTSSLPSDPVTTREVWRGTSQYSPTPRPMATMLNARAMRRLVACGRSTKLTIELSDAGSAGRSHRQLTWPARVRSIDFFSFVTPRILNLAAREDRLSLRPNAPAHIPHECGLVIQSLGHSFSHHAQLLEDVRAFALDGERHFKRDLVRPLHFRGVGHVQGRASAVCSDKRFG